MGAKCCKRNAEFEPLVSDKPQPQTKYSSTGGTDLISPRIHRAYSMHNTYILHVGLLGDLSIREKRVWLLRLSDGDDFEMDTAFTTQHISQCNKTFKLDEKNYRAQIQIMNELAVFSQDGEGGMSVADEHNLNRCNAILLCYDVTNLHSFNKLRRYLDLVKTEIQERNKQIIEIAVMGIVPSCDEQEKERKVEQTEASQLCQEYAGVINVQFMGESCAKSGDNVFESTQQVIRKCVQHHAKDRDNDKLN
eukprot:CAMPEP_0197040700 /NCGR_PEP_ID=MMETSP1384-20130603/17360_1 /TAXON_ID=29189 /ORGANISM="Ammonia sp." /LENGTH=248 /DNA_ID=CAMNT_0042471501 /DNA_START=62 /DNA_END=808 /DNA_ORIENTATION=+